MELRTLAKMGFHLQIIVNLANWSKLTEKDRIIFLEDSIASALKP
jgi:hypothetical protein